MIAIATLIPNQFQDSTRSLCVVCGDTGLVDVVLNILLFMPLGAGLARRGVRRAPALIGMALLSATIEGLQFSIISGRDSNLGDFLMNSAGGALGYLLAAESQRWIRPSGRAAARLTVCWTTIWLLVQSVASYATKPSMPDGTFFGQITRSRVAPFPGVFLGAVIGSEPVPDAAFPASKRIQQLLADNSTVTSVRVVVGGPTSRPSGIVRIADRSKHEIIALQQSRQDLIFTLRTRTAELRLRPLLFRLPGAFADRFRGDTVRISAQYGEKAVALAVRGSRDTVAAQFRLTPSFAWMMIFPFDVYINGTAFKAALACVWIAALVLPLGYWGSFWTRSRTAQSGRAAWLPWSLGGAAVLLVGMAIIPAAFGLGPCPLMEWVAGVAGLGLSAGAAARQRQENAV